MVKIILLIICIIAMIFLLNYNKKLEKERDIALKTPGTAERLRNNFPVLISMLLENSSHTIIIERKYDQSIRIGNEYRQELYISYSSLGIQGCEIFVACIDHSMVIKEWKFDRRLSDIQIYNEISNYFK